MCEGGLIERGRNRAFAVGIDRVPFFKTGTGTDLKNGKNAFEIVRKNPLRPTDIRPCEGNTALCRKTPREEILALGTTSW